MKFNFSFGNRSSKNKIIIVSLVITSIIISLSQCTGLDENKLWDLLDEIQREFFPKTIINEIIIKDPNKIDRRVERDVDKAIRQVTPEYDRIIEEDNKKYQPKYMDEKNDENLCYTDKCKSLSPPMRICAPWASDCIDTFNGGT